jgi:general secretion pathway protein K
MSGLDKQRGAALVLVMWLIAAMGITVGGALALAREEIGLASSRLGEAQAFALGKGIARLAVLDRARAQTAVDENGDPDPAGQTRVFKSRYEIEDLTVSATVYPASGFVSVAESDPEVWQQLFSSLGGMDDGSAAVLAERIVATEMVATSGAGSSAGSGPVGSFQFFSQHRQARAAVYVEQLLGVEGMNRAVYDRIRPNISPFNVGSGIDAAVAPPEIRAAFQASARETDEVLPNTPGRAMAAGYYCVEIEVSTSPSEGFTQRVWVESSGSDQYSSVKLTRIEKPRQKKRSRAG